jgi:NAD-dependent SIR2 family protein deacetylase
VVEDNTLYITGAGVSAESGIPTFRGGSLTWQGDYYEAKDARRAAQAMQSGQLEFLRPYAE